jgi:hypothetical protein
MVIIGPAIHSSSLVFAWLMEKLVPSLQMIKGQLELESPLNRLTSSLFSVPSSEELIRVHSNYLTQVGSAGNGYPMVRRNVFPMSPLA